MTNKLIRTTETDTITIHVTTIVPEAQEDTENYKAQVTETEVTTKETQDTTTIDEVRKGSQTERSGGVEIGLDADAGPRDQTEGDDLP